MLKLIRAHTVTQAGLLADVGTSYYELSGNMHILFSVSASFLLYQPPTSPPSTIATCHGEKGGALADNNKKNELM